MQKNIWITNALSSESDYTKMLKFCAEHNLYCFEFHYRHRKTDRRIKKGGTME